MTELDWAECGSERQYKKHRDRGEQPCTACRLAANRARAERKHRRKANA